MKVIADDEGFTGLVTIAEGEEAATRDLSDTVVASLTADGTFIGLDIMDTRPFGVPFDESAARRALDWAASRMDLGPTG